MYMARTNIDIDEDLIRRAMERYGLRTKREAVDLALRRLVGGEPLGLEEALAMRGSAGKATSPSCDRRDPPAEL